MHGALHLQMGMRPQKTLPSIVQPCALVAATALHEHQPLERVEGLAGKAIRDNTAAATTALRLKQEPYLLDARAFG